MTVKEREKVNKPRMNTEEHRLPEGWEWKKLGEVCEKINYGYTQKASFSDVGPKFLRITDIQNNHVDWEKVPFCEIEEKDIDKYLLSEGDILFARTGATTGKSYIIKGKFPRSVYASYLIRVQLKTYEVFPPFLYQFFQSFDYWKQISLNATGSAQGGVNATKLSNLTIPLPPLSEQKRIVAILDEAFASIDKAKANAEKNLANAKELFESCLNGIFANPGEDWEEKKLGEILDIARGGSPRPIKSYITDASNGINWIKIGDVKPGTKYIENTAQKIIPEGIKKSRFVEEGDFLLSNSMSFGRPYILKTSGCIHDGWLVLKKKANNIDENYLFQVLGSKPVIDQFDSLAAGSTVRNLNTTLVSKVSIPLPSLQQQKRIVVKLDRLFAETQKIKSIYQQKITALDELKKSILKKAFEGEL